MLDNINRKCAPELLDFTHKSLLSLNPMSLSVLAVTRPSSNTLASVPIHIQDDLMDLTASSKIAMGLAMKSWP